MEIKISRLGKINKAYDTFALKEALVKNDAGDWGSEPDENALGIIRSTNFTNEGKIKLDDIAYRTLKPTKVIEKTIYTNDILIERSGGSDSQPVGRVLFVDDFIGKGGYAFANFIQRIAVKNNFESKYIFYCLQQMYEVGITASMQNQTTGIRNLDWKLYTKTILPKPPKPEQTAIATILSKVDEAIEATAQSIKAAEKLKKALMQNLLSGKLKPDGTWRKANEFYEDEKFGKVPKGWEVEEIGNVLKRKTETIDPTKTKVVFDYVGLEHIISGRFTREGNGFSNETSSLKVCFNKGDVLLGKLRPYLNKVWVADISGVGSTEFLVFEKSDSVLWGYFNFQMKRFLNFTQSVTAGTQHPRASWKDIKRYLILIPSNKLELISIINKILVVDKRIQKKQAKIKTLERLKKSLMQQLLTGKKRLSEETIAHINQTL
ncbi:hypothetical protein A8C56_08360 [Niabella ginsenosidivorans]|uniref:Type I restriction modification DNA specificity domain-containing protein n=1 Tax=Niabella ginsenosidivorans TaxID=1176587 RepID=A0A1A9I1Q8_9BACT|nr:restriction endonuclease subunit S [Niabella ginsenosidivorans]ANH80989.1 hypothetical protein A8C56_08360 [Niabella ginsenosidivorans]